MMTDAIGPGIQRLLVELRPDLLCPWLSIPQANFMAFQADGIHQVPLHPHPKKDESLRLETEQHEPEVRWREPTDGEIICTFQFATGLQCLRRCRPCQAGVFKRLLKEFFNVTGQDRVKKSFRFGARIDVGHRVSFTACKEGGPHVAKHIHCAE